MGNKKILVNIIRPVHTKMYSPLSSTEITDRLQQHFDQTDALPWGLQKIGQFTGYKEENDTLKLYRLGKRGIWPYPEHLYSVYAIIKPTSSNDGTTLEIVFHSSKHFKVWAGLCILILVLTLCIAFPFLIVYIGGSYVHQNEIELLEEFLRDHVQASFLEP
ncbi:MAG: hypothetical protein VX278_08085 [Myxococcota bacterium]|nr:hypothetical protein [Myxococcota bacterium]